MDIIKREGSKQKFAPNKILTRIKKQAKGLKINSELLFQKVIPHIVDGMTTTEIDELIGFQAADLQIEHPDYSLLGGRILLTRQAKIIGEEITECDLSFDFFSASTFLGKYSKKDKDKKPLEIPSTMYKRVCEHLHDDGVEYKKLLDELMSKRGNFATPILTNAGIQERNGLISCNLTTLFEDSLDGIEETKKMVAKASKEGSGIGLNIAPLRSKKSMVSSFNNNAGGVVRFADMIQGTMRFYKQGERSGSCALYLPVHHKDIFDFLNLRLPIGEETMRTRDLFTAVVVDDVFMNALLNDEKYYLFCPNDIKKAGLKAMHDCHGKEFKELYETAIGLGLGEAVEPKKIWDAIIRSSVESGTPYVFYKDNANITNMQDNIGVVNMLNLCVTADTEILTSNGYQEIGNIEGDSVEVWNGVEWSKTKVIKTAQNQNILEVVTDSGQSLKSTYEHNYYRVKGKNSGKRTKYEKVDAIDLKIGDKLIKFELPIIEGSAEMKYPYTQGFFCGDGCNPNDNLYRTHQIALYGAKKELLPFIDVRYKMMQNGREKGNITEDKAILHQQDQDRILCYLPLDINTDKLFVPDASFTISTRLKWLSGLLDADGCVTDNDGSQSIQLVSTSFEFLKRMQLMLQTIGCTSKIVDFREEGLNLLPKNDGSGESKKYLCKKTYRILINGNSLNTLYNLGVDFKRLKITGKKPDRECSRFVKVKEIRDVEGLHDTFCFTEPIRNMGMFNGILTGQCAEIAQVSKPGYTPQCALASINLAEHLTLKSIAKTTKILVRALNKVIDKNKWSDAWSKNAGEDQRALAIGVAGLADFFAKKGISFESEEAKVWNKDIFETMYKAAVEESNKMAEEQGVVYPAWEGSKYSRGETYIKDWSPIEKGAPIKVLNSLFIGLMPTASSAILLGSFEMFEPVTSNIFTRMVGGGEFIVVNKYLVKDLEEIGMWTEDVRSDIIANEGSIQKMHNIPKHIRDIYKTVWEIPQKKLVDLAIIRSTYVDQSQSMNVYHAEAKYSKISTALMYAWKNKLKTGVYYTRTESKLGKNSKLSGSGEEKVTKPSSSMFSCAEGGGGCGA